jgi:hypothetical protein
MTNETLEEILAYQAQSDLDDEEEKRKYRLGECGKMKYRFDHHTKDIVFYTYECGMFRICKRCGHKRAEAFKAEIQNAISSGIKIARVTNLEEDFENFRTKHGIAADSYMQFPNENGNEILVNLDAVRDIRDSNFRYAILKSQDVSNMDWREYTNTPEGRAVSGQLTKKKSLVGEKKEEGTTINVPEFSTSADKKEVIGTMQSAIQETEDLDPKTPEEVEQALWKLTDIVSRRLKENGHQVMQSVRKLKVIPSKINWKKNSLYTKDSRRIVTQNRIEGLATSPVPV